MNYDELNHKCHGCDGNQWTNNEGYICIAPDGACPINLFNNKINEPLIKLIYK